MASLAGARAFTASSSNGLAYMAENIMVAGYYRCPIVMVAVNRTKVTGAPIPFGGMKQSGLGREGSRLGLEAFTEVKYVCRDWA